MAKFIELNKGWKNFGIAVICVLGAIGLFLGIVAIVGAANGLGFVGQLETIFGITKKVAEDVVTNPDNVEVAETVASLMI